jgi:segregation and condensation protein A
MQENDIEITGEFLEMAAKLIYIKTVSLLPKYEIEQLKKELEGALIEYALCKTTAERLRNYYIGDTIFTRNPAEIEIDLTYNLSHSLNELIESVCVVSERDKLRAEPVFSHPLTEVKIEYVSVFSKTLYILKRLRKGGKLELNGLFSDLKRSGKVAMFMALLELSSNGRIAFSQELDYIEFIKK